MQDKLNIFCIEADIIWENPYENKKVLDITLNNICSTSDVDIVLLPEMFTTGFSMQPQLLAEDKEGESVQWLQYCAKKYDILLGGSIIIKENERYYNRFYMIEPNGNKHHYDKRHLFRMGEENKYYTSGTKRCVVNYKGWRIMLQVCYDLRFPVWMRNSDDYDLLVYVANFPKNRKHVWDILLKARAIENQCFVAACNRTGVDDLGLSYSGDSQIISPKGLVVSKTNSHYSNIVEGNISLSELRKFREDFPVYLDNDEFTILESVDKI